MRIAKFCGPIVLLLLCLAACSNKMNVEELKKEGQKAFLNKQYKEARVFFHKVLQEKPSERDVLYFIGMAYRRDQIYDSALIFLKRAQLLYPADRELNQELLEVATGIENWQVALSAVQGLIGSGEPESKYYAEQADLWAKLQYAGNAYYWARKALTQDTSNPGLWVMTANYAAQVDSPDVALMLIDSAIAKFGEDDRFTGNRATFLSAKGEYKQAEALLRSLMAKDTANTYYKLNLANVLAAQKEFPKKREARDLYVLLKGKLGKEFKLDSLISSLDSTLK